jgi:hypothetical protein
MSIVGSDQYWMVLGKGVPRYRHSTEDGARTEAYRLAQFNPDQTFTVLKAVASVRVPRNPLPCWLTYDRQPKAVCSNVANHATCQSPVDKPNEFQATGQVFVGLNSASVMTPTEEPPF